MSDPLDYAVVTALVLAGVTAAGPWIRARLRGATRQVASFGGGVGLAYVFLQLFPEIDLAHAWLGSHVHLITLAAFLGFYVLGARLVSRSLAQGRTQDDERAAFWLHIGIMAFYTAMVVFTLPDEMADDLLFAAAGGLTIGLHLVYKDYVLRARHDERYAERGRYLLAAAPLVGWLGHRVAAPSEAVLDLFVAALAGVLIQGVFRDEVPAPDRALLGWVAGGIATFAALSILS